MKKKIQLIVTLLSMCVLAGTANATCGLHQPLTSVAEQDPGSSVDPVWPPIWWPGDQ